MIITIDGLTASGKSSAARLLASSLGYTHINSGLLYRTVAYVLVTNYDYDESKLQNPEAKDVDACLDKQRCVYVYDKATSSSSILYDGSDITSQLTTKRIDICASLVALNQYVHDMIALYVRELATHYHNCVVDGRNTGSQMFPSAEVKFFLQASTSVRAERWSQAKEKQYSHEVACQAITERDQRDLTRSVAPLIIPQDAHIIDSSNMTLQEVCEAMLFYVDKERKSHL